jgi:hypothetical protein
MLGLVLFLPATTASAAGHPAAAPVASSATSSQMSLAQAPAGLREAVEATLGADPAQIQQAELTALGGASLDEFGYTVALSGTTAVVGAPHGNSGTGAAYVFVGSGSSWSQQAELTAASGGAVGDEFGYSVAISGTTVVVGADEGNSGTGAAYVFVSSGTTWSQQAELTASGGMAGDHFGRSVAISGTTVVVGAPFSSLETGAVYIFVGSGSSWSPQQELTGGASGDYFGDAVALSGTTLVVTAPESNSKTGAAYVFVGSGSSWSPQGELTASDGASGDEFGYSVAISGTTVVVGAPYRSSDTGGAAYVFVGSGSSWPQEAELTASGGASGNEFGYSVTISGTIAVVGAPQSSDTGAAYLFVGLGSSWSQEAELTASDGAGGDDFGYSVAVSGTTTLMGADGKDASAGAAYVFGPPSYLSPTASGGYTLDAFGGLHPFGDSPPVTATGYWPDWDIARALAINPCDSTGQVSGWVLDGFGGLHPFAAPGTPMPPDPATTGYWPGWDIANDFVAFCITVGGVQHAAGCVLDGFGGLHPWADSSAVIGDVTCDGTGYWPGWDIATKIAVIPGTDQGYVMDGFGGLHPFNGAPVENPSGYWPGWEIATDLVATADGGYTLDGFGGIHPFGSAPAIAPTGYWPGWDIARGIDVAWAGGGVYTIDGFGGVHPAGGAPFLSVSGYWPGWAVVRDFITAP